MKLPKSWNEVTVNQWVELNSIDPNEFNSVFLHTLEAVSILSDTDPEDLGHAVSHEVRQLAYQIIINDHHLERDTWQQNNAD